MLSDLGGLVDAIKRVGVVDRSGRGVDKLYRSMLRSGRPEHGYRRTDLHSEALRLAVHGADEAFSV